MIELTEKAKFFAEINSSAIQSAEEAEKAASELFAYIKGILDNNDFLFDPKLF